MSLYFDNKDAFPFYTKTLHKKIRRHLEICPSTMIC